MTPTMTARTRLLTCGVAAAIALSAAPPAQAIDEQREAKGRAMIDSAIDYLRSQQDEATGGWSLPERDAQGAFTGPVLPAITGLAINGMLMHPEIDHTDPDVAQAVEFILSYRQEDGGIYDRILANYNTSLSVSALSRIDTPEARAAVREAIPFIRALQWSEASNELAGETGKVGPGHPFYGGVGYGRSGRPDNSNLNLMLQALDDAGIDGDDEAFKRAVTFLERTQMLDEFNDMPYAEGSSQGGFIYATSPNGNEIGVGESKAGTIQETLSDGTVASRLRSYGSMTYAGFKSYIYADLDRDDARVVAAYDWIRRHYTLEENPGIGADGYYYYLVTFSRALDAWGLDTIETIPAQTLGADGDAQTTQTRDWANDLIDQLALYQNADGSFRSIDDRWMEGNTVLITAYALLALQHAVN